MDCEFCKIIKGELPSSKLYEDDTTISIMDIADDVDGHILVIPKKHCKNILDCDSEALHDIMDTVQKVSRHLVDDCGYEGVNLLNASDESAGQTVAHFHIHIIPRKRSVLTNPVSEIIIKPTYKECARDKLVDRTPTCRAVRW